MQISDEQAAARDHAASCLVSAGAGSGKTTTLTERVLRLSLAPGGDITALLVITFTKAAAAEMRRRISGRLRSCAARGDARAEQQLRLLPQARIQTIHSFCEWLLRREWLRAGHDPGAGILEEAQAELLRHAALDQVLGQAYREDSGAVGLLQHYGGLDGDVALRGAVLALSRFLDVLPDAGEFVRQAIERLRLPEGDPEHTRLLGEEARAMALEAAEGLREAAEQGAEGRRAQQKEDAWRRAAGRVQEALSGERGFWELRAPLLAACTEALELLSGSAPPEASRTALRDLGEWLSAADPVLLLPRQIAQSAQVRLLGELALRARDVYRQLKRERSGLDFDDLEHDAYRLLRDEEVRTALRARFSEVLVDECQDVNPLQEAIIDLLTERAPNRGSLFAVGDVKQSIYRFRHAAPDRFLRRAAEYEAEGAALRLRENYRSRPEIIAVVNHAFGRLFVAEGGPTYREEDRLLGRRSAQSIPEDPDPSVRLWLIDPKPDDAEGGEGADGDPEEEEGDAEERAPEPYGAEAEALLVAREIERLVRSGHPVHDPETGEIRPIRYGDCAVLLRGVSGVARQYADAFFAAGVPLEASLGDGYLGSLEFRRLSALLRCVELPRRDVDLAVTLRGPWFAASAQDLLDIRQAAGPQPLWEGLRSRAQVDARMAAWVERIGRWRLLALRQPLGRLVTELLEDTGYLDHVASLPRAAQRLANIAEFERRGAEFSRLGGTLSGFLRLFEELGRKELDERTPPVVNPDAVQLLSIHRSKGLEYPVVFVGSVGRRIDGGHPQPDPLCHPNHGLGFSDVAGTGLRFHSPASRAIRYALRREDRQEEIRLLYVAMTRARDRLYLVGTVRKAEEALEVRPGPPSALRIAGGHSYFEWLRLSLLPDRGALPLEVQVMGIDALRLRGRVEDREIYAKIAAGAAAEPAEPALARAVRQLEGGPWPDPRPARITATELARGAEAEFSAVLRHRGQRVPHGPRSGANPAEVGTRTHRVLELLDFRPEAGPVLRQMQGFAARGLLPERALEVVDHAALERFLGTETGRRLAAPGARILRELEFALRLDANGRPSREGDQLVQGKIDLLLQDALGWLLLDFKTDRIARGDAARAAQAYRPQVEMYRSAVQEIAGVLDVEARLVFLGPGEEVLVAADRREEGRRSSPE